MLEKEFSFELIAQNDRARLGKIFTKRGEIDTPAFMPVGTQGTVKGIYTKDLVKTGTQIILGNTYHLLLRPGIQILKDFKGLHNFMNWNKPILTDSGGYQILSLSKFNKIDKDIGFDDGDIIRIHMPIRTNDDVVFTLYESTKDKDGTEYNLKTGHFYYTDVTKAHAVRNTSDIDRIHLVADCYSNKMMRALLN